MRLQIYDVEHGACALLTTDDGKRMMIDCGHNATTGWKPGTHLKQNLVNRVEMLAITNYDEDHVSGIGNLLDNLLLPMLWLNRSVSARTIQKLKTEDGMGPGIARLVQYLDGIPTPTALSIPIEAPTFSGVTWQTFCNQYPSFDDENNLSMVVHLNCNGVGVMFPGDLERAGWLQLLRDENFRQALGKTHVLVASHHGRENGCCEEIFAYCKPYYVVISDKGYMYDTQVTIPFYRKFTTGGPFRLDSTRHVLTTRKDGSITFEFAPSRWGPS